MKVSQVESGHETVRKVVPFRLRVASTVLRRAPVWSGFARITNLGWIRRAALGCDEEIDTELRNGVVVSARISDFNGRMLYLFGQTDPKVIRVCSALLGPEDVFLDIGANHGEVGLLCGRNQAGDREVHLFEPLPQLAASIEASARRHGMSRVEVHACGLGPADETLPIRFDSGHTGKASVVGTEEATSDALRVPIRETLSVLREIGEDRPVGAKVDVEGGEAAIVPPLLEWPQTRFVVFEWEHLPEPGEFLAKVQSLGFEVYGLEKRLFAPRLVPATRLDRTISDVVAVRRALLRNDLSGRRISSLDRRDLV